MGVGVGWRARKYMICAVIAGSAPPSPAPNGKLRLADPEPHQPDLVLLALGAVPGRAGRHQIQRLPAHPHRGLHDGLAPRREPRLAAEAHQRPAAGKKIKKGTGKSQERNGPCPGLLYTCIQTLYIHVYLYIYMYIYTYTRIWPRGRQTKFGPLSDPGLSGLWGGGGAAGGGGGVEVASLRGGFPPGPFSKTIFFVTRQTWGRGGGGVRGAGCNANNGWGYTRYTRAGGLIHTCICICIYIYMYNVYNNPGLAHS